MVVLEASLVKVPNKDLKDARNYLCLFLLLLIRILTFMIDLALQLNLPVLHALPHPYDIHSYFFQLLLSFIFL